MTTVNPSEIPKVAAAYDMTAASFDMPTLIAHGDDDWIVPNGRRGGRTDHRIPGTL